MDFLRNSEGHFWVDSRDAIASKNRKYTTSCQCAQSAQEFVWVFATGKGNTNVNVNGSK